MLTILSGTALASKSRTHVTGAVLRLTNEGARSLSRWVARRHQLRALADLDEHLLRDIGLTRKAAERACSQSFWVP